MKRQALRWALPLVLFAVAGVGAAMAMSASHGARGTVDTATRGSFGAVLVTANGRTLYRYTKDAKRKSTCTGACLKFWPALLVPLKPTAGPGVKSSLLGTIRAAGGRRQVTYAGYPLYTFAGDKKAGAVSGEGYAGTWYLVSPTGALVKRGSAPGGAASTTTTPSTSTSGSAWG
jgi:predicted lipoprotein with Yx(FWY)xxD motif